MDKNAKRVSFFENIKFISETIKIPEENTHHRIHFLKEGRVVCHHPLSQQQFHQSSQIAFN